MVQLYTNWESITKTNQMVLRKRGYFRKLSDNHQSIGGGKRLVVEEYSTKFKLDKLRNAET